MKIIILSLALFFTLSNVFCQSFMQGAGATVSVTSTKGGDVAVSEGFTYSPRFNFVETESLSVSVGIPFTAGFSVNYSTDYYGYDPETATIGFVVNAPLVINLNVGRGSTKDNTGKFGYFIGAGFGYHRGDFLITAEDNNGYEYMETRSLNTYGPDANAGMRFGVGNKYRNIEVRFSYMKGINDYKVNIFGVAGLFNF